MASAQGYAESLSEYEEKGRLNLQNSPDCSPAVYHKSRYLAQLIRDSSYVVVHTGAGISTSAGIADFRGPHGVWTIEKRPSKRPRRTVPFHRAIPSLTHMALVTMYKRNYIHHVVSQNVDALHLRSGLPRSALSELHGNIFMEHCKECGAEHLRDKPVNTVGLKPTGNVCPCGGDLYDKALDWEDPLPDADFEAAKDHAEKADLNIVLGTSCQMEPARLIPFRGKGGKAAVVLVNLSETPFDDRFGFLIRAKCDDVFSILATELALRLDVFERRIPVRLNAKRVGEKFHYSLWQRDGAPVDGVEEVRYGDERGSGQGFKATTNETVTVVVQFDNGRKQALPRNETDVDLVIDTKDWSADADKGCSSVRTKARLYDGPIDAKEFFVAGKRRGWGICALCMSEVWCSSGKRDAHIRDCLKRKPI